MACVELHLGKPSKKSAHLWKSSIREVLKENMYFIHILWIRGGGPQKWIRARGGGLADVDNN